MAIRFANEIIDEIEKRGFITVPRGNVTGDEFEKWLMNDYCMEMETFQVMEKVITSNTDINDFYDNFGDAA